MELSLLHVHNNVGMSYKYCIYVSNTASLFCFKSNDKTRMLQARQGWNFKAGPKYLLFYPIVKARYCDCKNLLEIILWLVPKICFVIALTSSWILLLLANIRKVNARGCFIGFRKLSFIHLSTTHFDLNKSLQIQFTGHFCSSVQFNTNILYTRHIFHSP